MVRIGSLYCFDTASTEFGDVEIEAAVADDLDRHAVGRASLAPSAMPPDEPSPPPPTRISVSGNGRGICCCTAGVLRVASPKTMSFGSMRLPSSAQR